MRLGWGGRFASSWVILSRGVIGDPAPGETQSWGAVRSDVPRALGAREVKLVNSARVAVAPSPPGGRPSAGPGARRSSGGVKPGRGGMGAGVGVLLLAQLLVRVELEMQGELRPEPGVSGVGGEHGHRGELTFSPHPRVAGSEPAVFR